MRPHTVAHFLSQSATLSRDGLFNSADELHADQCIGDATWDQLRDVYDQLQLMDVVFAVGQYTLVAMALKSFGTPLDEGLDGF